MPSELPWKVCQARSLVGDVECAVIVSDNKMPVAEVMKDEDAALIVKAVRSHERYFRALEEIAKTSGPAAQIAITALEDHGIVIPRM